MADEQKNEPKIPSAKEVDAKFGEPVRTGPADDFDRRTVFKAPVTPVTEHRQEMEQASAPAEKPKAASKPAAKKPTQVKK